MTHSPPVPPSNQSPYPIAEPPHPHPAPDAERPVTRAAASDIGLAPAVIAGAVIAGAAVVAGTVFAFLRARGRAEPAGKPAATSARRSFNKAKPAAGARLGAKATRADVRKTPASAKTGSAKTKARGPATGRRSASGDDMAERGPRDASLIAMGEDHEVRYWTRRFGVDREALQRAVDAVGNGAKTVEHELKRS